MSREFSVYGNAFGVDASAVSLTDEELTQWCNDKTTWPITHKRCLSHPENEKVNVFKHHVSVAEIKGSNNSLTSEDVLPGLTFQLRELRLD